MSCRDRAAIGVRASASGLRSYIRLFALLVVTLVGFLLAIASPSSALSAGPTGTEIERHVAAQSNEPEAGRACSPAENASNGATGGARLPDAPTTVAAACAQKLRGELWNDRSQCCGSVAARVVADVIGTDCESSRFTDGTSPRSEYWFCEPPHHHDRAGRVSARSGYDALHLLRVSRPLVATKPAGALVEEGTYVVKTAQGEYVGQSGAISRRLQQHVASGKFTQAEVDAAERAMVTGGKLQREIAEQLLIDSKGGIDGLLNKVNPIGPKRVSVMPNQPYKR